MAIFTGTNGNDGFPGTANPDIFNMFQGGNDTVTGDLGNDVFNFLNTFNSSDSITGGGGNDTLTLSGDYSAQLLITSAMLSSVERITVAPEHSYNLAIGNGVIAPGGSLIISATKLGVADTLQIDTTAVVGRGAPATTVILGGAGPTLITAGAEPLFLHGSTGQDSVQFGATFNTSDNLDGVSGVGDNIHLDGDYSAGLVIIGTMMRNFDSLFVDDSFNYRLTLQDGVVAAGGSLNVFVASPGIAGNLYFDGSQETDGAFSVYDGIGNDVLRGGAEGDFLEGSAGNDKLYGMDGNDTLSMADGLTSLDRIDGGNDYDTLLLTGDYSAGVHITATMVKNVEAIYANPGGDYRISTADSLVAAGLTLDVSAPTLVAGDWLKFNGSAETDGNFNISSAAGKDTLIGGAGNDSFWAGKGSDLLTGNGGSDTFTYLNLVESRANLHDTITDFDAAADHFKLAAFLTTPTAVDAAVAGTLNAATYTTDLVTALDAAHLGAHHAAVFTASGGDLTGHSFLVVDVNGVAGYQLAGDLLVDITGAANLGSFGIGDFI